MLKTMIAAVALVACLPAAGLAQSVDELIAKNLAARGGAQAWRDVYALRMSGRMELGQDLLVPYTLEQKRPAKMRLEYEFDGETAIQCVDGETGWKLAPFRGRSTPEPMTATELHDAAGSVDLYGPLYDHAARGHSVELLGREEVEGRDAFKLKVTLHGGSIRWVYLDAETGLELKLEALRTLAGRERRVETFYRDWQATEGLLIARRQETRSEGEKKTHLLTVDSVSVNPALDDSRFGMPGSATGPGA